MKFHYKIIISFSLAACIASAATGAKTSSVMSNGKWVEVTAKGSGVKKITFSQLRDMGFEKPECVSVYGKEGLSLPLPFFDSEGNSLQPDDLNAIACLHTEDALYFYATGTDSYSFETDPESPTGGYYRHLGKNIYTDKSIFLLSDHESGQHISTVFASDSEGIGPVSFGLGLIFHEEDLEQNNCNNGQLFWGEEFPADGSRLAWDYTLPGSSGLPSEMQYSLHIESDSGYGPQGEYTFGILGTSGSSGESPEVSASHAPIRNKTSYHFAQETEPFRFVMPSDTGKVFASYDRGGSECTVANLDWWSLTARFDIAKRLDSENYFTFAIPGNGNRQVSFQAPDWLEVWDVTDPTHPVRLGRKSGADEIRVDFNGSDFRMLSVFNPDSEIPGISGWREAPNQNLHSLSSEGADFAIICLPWLRDKALEIAQIHEAEMGQKCVVATTEETYREFSGGMPDPMAYRNFVKMLYDSPTRVKNLLLLGTITADARGVKATEGREERIISYQKSLSSKHDGAMSDVDIYGVTDTRITDKSSLESMTVAVGVGILPVSSAAEADYYIEKLKRHLSGEGMEQTIAEHLLIGCDGDNHQHENQCEGVRGQLDGYNRGYRHTPVYNDQIGVDLARRKIIEGFNSGIGLATYIGHGGSLLLTKCDGYFGYPDLRFLRNASAPFMFFAACNITNGDMGQRGMSEQMVVGSPFGLIGAVTSNRTAMSTSNYELIKTFYSELQPSVDPATAGTLQHTVGEAYARTKTSIKSINELSFQLMCDPAIVIPLPSCGMTYPGIDLPIGEMTTVGGHVTDSEGNILKNFNGKACVRIVVPGEDTLISGEVTGKEGSWVKGEEKVLAIGSGEVKEGVYEVSVAPGQTCTGYEGETLKVLLAAYDAHLKTGAASAYECTLLADEDFISSGNDTTAPQVESVEYDDTPGALIITSADDTALDLFSDGLQSSFSVRIDGKPLEPHLLRNVEFLPDASRCRHTVYLPTQENGMHTVSLRMTDTAGNASEYETVFTVGGKESLLILGAECRHTDHKINFHIDTELPLAELVIRIADASGHIKASVPVTDNTLVTDTDAIPAGLAKVWCEDIKSGIRSHTLTIPIIKPESSR